MIRTVFLILCLLPSSARGQSALAAGIDEYDAGRSVATQMEVPVQRFKKQAIQSVAVSGGWLQAVESGSVSSSYFETSIGLGVPLGMIRGKIGGASDTTFDVNDILGVTPSFRVDYFNAAPGIDIPSELFETGVSFYYRKPFNDRWSAMAVMKPSVRSDFTTSDEAFRIFGLAMMTWDCVPNNLSLSFGVVYLDRADLSLLPAAGLTWTPKPTSRLDIRFPESRLAWRLAKNGCHSETWSYVSAGLGGNTWAVTRASGQTDELSLRDYRTSIGFEHIVDGGGGWFVEAGYSFSRQIEYQSTQTEVGLSDGVLFQAGWRY